MSKIISENRKAYIITGPTSGAGRATALEMAKHGTLVLVGRNSKSGQQQHGRGCGMYTVASRAKSKAGCDRRG